MKHALTNIEHNDLVYMRCDERLVIVDGMKIFHRVREIKNSRKLNRDAIKVCKSVIADYEMKGFRMIKNTPNKGLIVETFPNWRSKKHREMINRLLNVGVSNHG